MHNPLKNFSEIFRSESETLILIFSLENIKIERGFRSKMYMHSPKIFSENFRPEATKIIHFSYH